MEKINKKIELPRRLLDISLNDFEVIKKLPSHLTDSGLDRNQAQFEFNVDMNVNPTNEIINLKLNTKFFAEKSKEN